MNTAHFSRARPIRQGQDRDHPAEMRDSLLVVSGVLAAATILFTLALVSDRLHEAVILEPSPPATVSSVAPVVNEETFRQQKLDAKYGELPAQF